MAKEKYWVGFDLGGTKMYAVVFDAKFHIVGKARQKTKGFQGKASGLKRMVETLQEALEDAGIKKSDLGGIGVGCPGPCDIEKGVVLNMPNLGWTKAPVKAELEKEFKCPVFVLNDVDAGVYGEYRFGAGKNARCLLGVFPGTGIGGGLVHDGKIFHGAGISCMEIGHIPVMTNGPQCGCGRWGCLETVASRLAISAEAAKAAYRGEAPVLMDAAGTNLVNIKSGVLASSVKGGDKVVEDIIKHAAWQIGKALGGVINMLSPDRIVLGGGLIEALPNLFCNGVSKAAGKHVMQTYKDSFKVVVAELGDEAGAQGAAAWAKDAVKNHE